MIKDSSKKREIRDLQRLLVSLELLELTDEDELGRWGDDTQRAVIRAYDALGWDHPLDGRWITAPALAAITTVYSVKLHAAVGGPGMHAGGPGMHAGGPGMHAGGPGMHAGGPGMHAGGPGMHAGADSTPE